ncbi:serine hydrolase [Rugosimonospora africana]|uniref:Beta-lactamase n=1 Tax=Rugosimonospora africana TaxID=556532 RepID=A0A8J3QQX6_9ACTN|nr:serine hydrolase [Rugosimonospora africana]GIH14137.1 serine hydrolase [Rugosimonospora africana]
MTPRLNRRAALGLGTTVAAGTVLAAGKAAVAAPASSATKALTPPPVPSSLTPAQLRDYVAAVYKACSTAAGGTWNAQITVVGSDGTLMPAVQQRQDTVVEAYSVNKIAVATAVLDKIDRGELTLDQRVDVTDQIIQPISDGIFCLDQAYPSSITLGHVMAAMLTVSDDIAVRLCGLVCPGPEINEILVAKGFPNTQVEPVEGNPHRMYLGLTTPHEMHDLLHGLLNGTVISASSADFLFSLIRSQIAFTDGIRQQMSSDERARVATKAGWFDDARNEAGVIFDADGRPVLTYSMFAAGMADPDNFGATHPALEARAAMGRAWLSAVDNLSSPVAATRHATPRHPMTNGG